jgi:hypothetical protein
MKIHSLVSETTVTVSSFSPRVRSFPCDDAPSKASMHVPNEPTAGAAWHYGSGPRKQRDGAATRQLRPPRGRVKSRARRRRRRGRSLPCGELIELDRLVVAWVGLGRRRPVLRAGGPSLSRLQLQASMDEACAPLHVRSFHWCIAFHGSTPAVRHTHAWSPSLSCYCWCMAARLQLMRGKL